MAKESLHKGEFGKFPLGAGIRLVDRAGAEALRSLFASRAGLRPDQVAINNFNFPPIPIPEERTVDNKTRMAPKNVSNSYLGHPIYWIDPKLTRFHEEYETRETWSIRMYYLIDGFNYWDSEMNFIDYLDVHGFDYEDTADIELYHRNGNPDCLFDEYGLLGVEDLDVDVKLMEENFRNAMAQCDHLVRSEYKRYMSVLASNYKLAREFLMVNSSPKGGIWDSNTTHDTKGGHWNLKYQYIFGALVLELEQRLAESENPQVSDFVVALNETFTDLMEEIEDMNKASSMLNIPVQAVNPTIGNKEMLSVVSNLLMLSAKKDNLRKQYGSVILEEIENFARSEKVTVETLVSVFTVMERVYAETWRRLRLAFINYHVVSRAQVPFASYADMVNSLVAVDQGLEDSYSDELQF